MISPPLWFREGEVANKKTSQKSTTNNSTNQHASVILWAAIPPNLSFPPTAHDQARSSAQTEFHHEQKKWLVRAVFPRRQFDDIFPILFWYRNYWGWLYCIVAPQGSQEMLSDPSAACFSPSWRMVMKAPSLRNQSTCHFWQLEGFHTLWSVFVGFMKKRFFPSDLAMGYYLTCALAAWETHRGTELSWIGWWRIWTSYGIGWNKTKSIQGERKIEDILNTLGPVDPIVEKHLLKATTC